MTIAGIKDEVVDSPRQTYLTDDFHIINLALSVGNDIFGLTFESVVPFNS